MMCPLCQETMKYINVGIDELNRHECNNSQHKISYYEDTYWWIHDLSSGIDITYDNVDNSYFLSLDGEKIETQPIDFKDSKTVIERYKKLKAFL